MKLTGTDLAKIFVGMDVSYIDSNRQFFFNLPFVNPDFLDNVIILCRQFHFYDKVVYFAELACELFPKSWQGFVRLAKEYIRENKFTESRDILDRGLESAGRGLMLLCTYADLERAVGSRSKSLLISREIKRSFPENFQGYVCEIRDLVALGQLNLASSLENKIPPELFSRKEIQDCLGWLSEVLNADAKRPVLSTVWLDIFSSSEVSKESYSQVCLTHERNSIFHEIYPFQYWSQGTPPKELVEITDVWNSILSDLSIAPIKIWNRVQALEWIASNEPGFLNTFQSAPHFASEADIFRLLIAKSRSSIWIDSDYYPKEMTKLILSNVLSNNFSALIMLPPQSKPPYINNAFFVSSYNCPYFNRCVESMRDFSFSDKAVTQSLVSNSFGPGLYNRTFDELFPNTDDVIIDKSRKPCSYLLSTSKLSIQLLENTTFAFNKKPGLDMASLDNYSNWKKLNR